jgi:diguanylate cyclase
MQQIPNHQLVTEWLRLLDGYPAEAAAALNAVAEEKSAELAEHFYSQMLADPHSASFLSHDQVKNRLGKSMQKWIVTVCSSTAHSDLDAVVDLQRKVGEIHARIEIPVSLVLRGARSLKGRLRELLEQRDLGEPVRRKAARMGADLIDLAVEIICFAYSQSHDRNSRAEEAYRLFSVSQNIGVEKERQRAALLDWENQLMFDLAIGNLSGALPQLAGSEFGLWFRHKASHAFQGSPESASILDYIERIDVELKAIATLQETGERLAKLHHIREQTRSIKFLLDSLFEQANDLEAGRDVLTRLLNRKFLPVVMAKEVLYARQSNNAFGVLAIDVDHFKRINDTYGHEAGDQVLREAARRLVAALRASDSLLRWGGEEFLLIMPDTDMLQARQALERIVGQGLGQRPDGAALTASIGLAERRCDQVADYRDLLELADKRMYRAKTSGRNRLCVMEPEALEQGTFVLGA